jgi:hypothetical protein
MTRRVKTVIAKIQDGATETDSGTLSKAVYDVVNGKTVISISFQKIGTGVWGVALIVYDET